MPITRKQRNLIWVGIVALAGIYYAPTIITATQNFQYAHTQAIRDRQEAAQYHAPEPAPRPAIPVITINGISPADTAALEQFSKLTGKWAGAGVINDRGLCHMSLEMHLGSKTPGDYEGFATIGCSTALALLGHPKGGPDLANQAMNAMIPTSLIMNGPVHDGAIRFKVLQTIGSSPNCTLTDMQVTPFGNQQIALQWQGQQPSGGNMHGQHADAEGNAVSRHATSEAHVHPAQCTVSSNLLGGRLPGLPALPGLVMGNWALVQLTDLDAWSQRLEPLEARYTFGGLRDDELEFIAGA